MYEFNVTSFLTLLLARVMGQYCFARWRLSSSVVVCNTLFYVSVHLRLHFTCYGMRSVMLQINEYDDDDDDDDDG